MNPSDWTSKFFSYKELATRDTGICALAAGFLDRIDALRVAWGGPLTVNSCCRTASYNKAIGGHPKSLHVCDTPFHPTGGSCAIDFRLMDSVSNERLKKLAISMGFSVGDEAGTIHIDDRTRVLGLPQQRFNYVPNPTKD